MREAAVIEYTQSLSSVLAAEPSILGAPTDQAHSLFAETGGQNALIVDSSALPEQVVSDVLSSAFDSAGQRCSALRVLCLQNDIAEHTLLADLLQHSDARRNLLGLFMPLAIVVFVALLVPYPRAQQAAPLLCTVMLLLMLVEGFFSGRRVTKQVRAKFPKETVNGRSVGFYAFVRASQIRKLRVPKPRVSPGDSV